MSIPSRRHRIFTTQLLLIKDLVSMPVAWGTKLNDSMEEVMKRAPRTTITWRFENPMAPHDTNYLPCTALSSRLVKVVTTLFRGKALMQCWFVLDKKLESFMDQNPHTFFFFFASNDGGKKICEVAGVRLDGPVENRTGAIYRNGDAICVDFTFDRVSGENFLHTACNRFIDLVNNLGDPKFRKLFFLPYPEISQVTMVEAYTDDHWVEYGEYLWEQFFALKADASAEAAQRQIHSDEPFYHEVYGFIRPSLLKKLTEGRG